MMKTSYESSSHISGARKEHASHFNQVNSYIYENSLDINAPIIEINVKLKTIVIIQVNIKVMHIAKRI